MQKFAAKGGAFARARGASGTDSGRLLFFSLERIRRWNLAFVWTDMFATKSDRFQDDSETTVYQIDVRHAGISGFSFLRHEIRPVDTIHVGP